MTGHLEQEFTGVDPLRGQSNVQGACDMGALPAVFPGYQAVADETVRTRFEQAWGVQLSDRPGLTNLDMTHGSSLRGLLVVGENPLISDPNLNNVRNTFHGYDFLAVSDIFLSDTAKLADVVFPAASFAEKEGTITSSERRVQRLHRAIAPVGASRPDSEIIMDLAGRMGYPMEYGSAAEIMEEICLLTPIYGGMYHDRLDKNWGLQWPCPDRAHGSTQYLHKYSFTRGRGRFEPSHHVAPAEEPDSQYPFVLVTGRVYHQYHTGTMTRHSGLHNREHGRALLEVHPDDAGSLGLGNGDRVRVVSRRGECSLHVLLTDRTAPGHVFTSFHFRESPVNRVTVDTSDPVARCPEFKVCAVRIEKDDAHGE
jgi:formate dehydrogenase major subunit/formate dehydrogenase alpha subunit